MWSAIGHLNDGPLRFLSKLLKPVRKQPQAVRGPKPLQPVTPTSNSETEIVLEQLHSKKASWLDVDVSHRAELLQQVLDGLVAISKDAAHEASSVHGSYGSGTGEDRMLFVVCVANTYELLAAMRAQGHPKPLSLRQRSNGQWVADVWPYGLLGLFFPESSGEVWIKPGSEPSQGATYAAKAAGTPLHTGRLSLVLGAGNSLPVVVGDILHKLFVEDSVVVCKMNPANDHYGPHLTRALKPLIDLGVVAFVYGGADVGKLLTDHPLVEDIHITGSAKTFNAIVWGDPEGPKRDEAGQLPAPRLSKHITGELGNVTPYIVVPGTWSSEDLEYYADQIASASEHNCGHNCIAAQVIITSADWPQHGAFMQALRSRLDAAPRRCPWYPGSGQKYTEFRQRFPQAEELGRVPEGVTAEPGTPGFQPKLLAAGLSPEQVEGSMESFVTTLREVPLPGMGDDVAAFLQRAVAFANDRCWGSLGAGLIIHPKTQREHSAAFEQALSELRYGCIAVNATLQLAYSTTGLPWGAFPGNPLHDIGSGNCFVHNTSLFDHAQKGVLRMCWRYAVKPPWSTSNTNLEDFAPWVMAFQAHPEDVLKSLALLPGCVYHALRS